MFIETNALPLSQATTV